MTHPIRNILPLVCCVAVFACNTSAPKTAPSKDMTQPRTSNTPASSTGSSKTPIVTPNPHPKLETTKPPSPATHIKGLLDHITTHSKKDDAQAKQQITLAHKGIANLLGDDRNTPQYQTSRAHLKKARALKTPAIVASCSLRPLTSLKGEKHTPKAICDAHLMAHPTYTSSSAKPSCYTKALHTLSTDTTRAHVLKYRQGKIKALVLAVYTNNHWYSAPIDIKERVSGEGWRASYRIKATPRTIEPGARAVIEMHIKHTKHFHLSHRDRPTVESFEDRHSALMVTTGAAPKIIYSIDTMARYQKIIHRKLRTLIHMSVVTKVLPSGQVKLLRRAHVKPNNTKSIIKPGTYPMNQLNRRCLTN